jgi:hypothetical protein
MKDEILRLRAEGKTYTEIQEALGCSKGTISYHCGYGQREKVRARGRDARSKVVKFVQEYKQARACADCGEDYPYWIMHFDHLSDKTFDISKWKKYTSDINVVKREIEKCEVVCANCHANRTHLRLLKTSGDTIDLVERYA